MNKPFLANQFTATRWSTTEDKAKFANHLIRFIKSDYKQTLFYDWFYNRLSMTFGHIAHYNRLGFYDHFFTTPGGKTEFMNTLKTGGGYGDPTCTYSDVEWAVRRYLTQKVEPCN